MHSFSAHVITGSGRGKAIGTPTINLELSSIPRDVKEGIYAAFAQIDGKWLHAAVHYGPRPVFNDTKSFEVYLLDANNPAVPDTLTVQLVERLRDVKNFPSPEALFAQIQQDVLEARGILEAHGTPSS